MNKPILIDCSLTGGRGPAKKVWEIVQDLEIEDIPYKLLTDRVFSFKLQDMGLEPDYIIDTGFSDAPELIIQKFDETIRKLDFLFLVKYGARIAGPIAARKMNKPYFIVDGGLPSYMENRECLYEKKTYQQAIKYFLTTQFYWRYPKPNELQNIQTCFAVSEQTMQYLDTLRQNTKIENVNSVQEKLRGTLPRNGSDLLINLIITGDYLRPYNRKTYNAWLKTWQYDQSVGFLRRLITDLGINTEKVYVFMDIELQEIVTDLLMKYPSVSPITYKRTWDLRTELVMKAAADITISRATNYQPYIAALSKGGNITTPVPANGYMNEDSAGKQYERKRFTKLIPFDDEKYIFKVLDFAKDLKAQKKIEIALKNNRFLKERSLNRLLIKYYKGNE